MTKFESGEIIIIPFPFSDLSGKKKRPALVLAVVEDKQEIICMMLTSVQGKTQLDYNILHWKEAGLLKPTTAKIQRLFIVSYAMVLKKLGKLEAKEFADVLDRVITLLKNTEKVKS